MTAKTWTAGTTGNWSTASNWTPVGVPAADDDVTLPGFATAYTVTLDVASAALDSLTIGDGASAGLITLAIGSNTLNVNGSGGGATDAITLQEPGSVAISIAGGTINATSLAFGTSSDIVSGTGFLAIATISGSGELLASGGALAVGGTVNSGVNLQIDTVAGSTLVIGGTATAATAIAITNANQKLEIATGGTLTITPAESIINGTIQLDSSTSVLNANTSLTVGTNAKVIGQGAVNTGTPLSGTGTVEASGGTLSLGPLSASTGIAYQVASASTLKVNGQVSTGNSFAFLNDSGNSGTVGIQDDTGMNATLSGMFVGASNITPTDAVDLAGFSGTITLVTGQGTNAGTITLSDGAVLNLAALSATNWFADMVSDGSGGMDIFVSTVACYCRGTLILTADGEVPVEELAIGDDIITFRGDAKPIKWIGRRSYTGWLAAGNPKVMPICFKPGSLADGVPKRELWVSPEHAIFLDGVLVPAELLVNGISIVKAETVEEVHYYHLELGEHGVILAEGAWAESFVDDDSRGMFHNAAEFRQLYPEAGQAPARYCAPRVEGGFELEALRRRLDGRARRLRSDGTAMAPVLEGHLDLVQHDRIEGWTRNPEWPQARVALVILADGAEIGRVMADRYRHDLLAAGIGDGCHAFELVIPGGLTIEWEHTIEVCHADDWTTPLPGSPAVLEPTALRGLRRA